MDSPAEPAKLLFGRVAVARRAARGECRNRMLELGDGAGWFAGAGQRASGEGS